MQNELTAERVDASIEYMEEMYRCCDTQTGNVPKAYLTAIAALRAQKKEPNIGRKYALTTGLCPMCEDCPDGCPILAPNDSRNAQEKAPCGWISVQDRLSDMCGCKCLVAAVNKFGQTEVFTA